MRKNTKILLEILITLIFTISSDPKRDLTVISKKFNYFYDYFPIVCILIIDVYFFHAVFERNKRKNKGILTFIDKLYVILALLILNLVFV